MRWQRKEGRLGYCCHPYHHPLLSLHLKFWLWVFHGFHATRPGFLLDSSSNRQTPLVELISWLLNSVSFIFLSFGGLWRRKLLSAAYDLKVVSQSPVRRLRSSTTHVTNSLYSILSIQKHKMDFDQIMSDTVWLTDRSIYFKYKTHAWWCWHFR